MSTLHVSESERLRAITAATPLDTLLRAAQTDQLLREAFAAKRTGPYCRGCTLPVHPGDAVSSVTGDLTFHLRCAPPPAPVSVAPRRWSWPRIMVGVGPFRMELVDLVHTLALRALHKLGLVR